MSSIKSIVAASSGSGGRTPNGAAAQISQLDSQRPGWAPANQTAGRGVTDDGSRP